LQTRRLAISFAGLNSCSTIGGGLWSCEAIPF